MDYITGKTFDKINTLERAEYDSCTFSGCDLSGADLSGIQFSGCTFKESNLSMAKMLNTALRDVAFDNCKLMGLRFESCNGFLFDARFDQCQLNLSSFYKMKLKNMKFTGCSLREVDFTEADLSAATFDRCDLAGATFDHTNLEQADFRTAYHHALDPENNRIRKAKFSQTGLAGLLGKYGIEIE